MHTYRGWSIDFDMKPIPFRGWDWTATEDDRQVHGATLEEVMAEIDAEEDE